MGCSYRDDKQRQLSVEDRSDTGRADGKKRRLGETGLTCRSVLVSIWIPSNLALDGSLGNELRMNVPCYSPSDEGET